MSSQSHSRSSAFTRVELVVGLVVVAVVLVLAWPTFKSALTKRDLTRTMNNGRELYLAAFRMATDGAAKSDANLAWPGDYPVNSLSEYAGKLVEMGYVRPADLQRMLSASGADCTIATSESPVTTTLKGKSALKIYKVKRSDPSNTIFITSSNYIYDTELNGKAEPFGDAGFVVVRKSGDAGVYKKGQATAAGYDDNAARFQTEIGILPGTAKGDVAPGDGATVLAGPQ